MRRNTINRSEPYFYVDLASKDKIESSRNSYITHDKFQKLTGYIDLNIIVESEYLFIGSGLNDYNNSEVYNSYFKSQGEFIIPGSSIKGAVRSVAEAISDSCVSVTKYKERSWTQLGRCSGARICPACRIFGTTRVAGRINFSDARLKLNNKVEFTDYVRIKELYSPRGDRTSKRKFYKNINFVNQQISTNYIVLEAVKKQSVFKSRLSFQNMLEEELSLILYSMGVNQDYRIKIGGAKPRCFGIVKIEPIEVALLKTDKNNISIPLEFESPPENTSSWILKIMNNTKLLDRQLFEEFKKGAKTSFVSVSI